MRHPHIIDNNEEDDTDELAERIFTGIVGAFAILGLASLSMLVSILMKGGRIIVEY